MWLAALVVALGATAVGCGGSAEQGEEREVLIDYVDDQVASSFLLYFPRNVAVHPGDTVVFTQEWTGEPHSVTMGTMVDDMMAVVGPLIEEYGDSPEPPPAEVLEQYEAAMEPLPWMADDNLNVQQNAAQPCFLDDGGPPEDPATPCSPAEQEQPPFNGRQSYYNSGFIPYEGTDGNEYRVPLADDIEPGVYSFYCNLHGPFQSGTITVVEPDEPIPSQAEVARQGRREIEEIAQPLREAYSAAAEGETEVLGQTVPKPLAGFFSEAAANAFISEFIPQRIEIDVGDAVTWHFIGPHTVSFDVPSYFAQITIDDDGTVIFNEDAYKPVNSPGPPEPPAPPDGEDPGGGQDTDGDGAPVDAAAAEGGTPPDDGGDAGAGPEGEPEPIVVDAGDWNGSGFISSGVFYEHAYRLRFTEAGSYPYACLIHPQMVGEVVVR
jgi:plastocyanin